MATLKKFCTVGSLKAVSVNPFSALNVSHGSLPGLPSIKIYICIYISWLDSELLYCDKYDSNLGYIEPSII